GVPGAPSAQNCEQVWNRQVVRQTNSMKAQLVVHARPLGGGIDPIEECSRLLFRSIVAEPQHGFSMQAVLAILYGGQTEDRLCRKHAKQDKAVAAAFSLTDLCRGSQIALESVVAGGSLRHCGKVRSAKIQEAKATPLGTPVTAAPVRS